MAKGKPAVPGDDKRTGPRDGGSRVVDEDGNVISINGLSVDKSSDKKRTRDSKAGGGND